MIIGIDPGMTGALALLDDDLELVDAYDMPVADGKITAVFIAVWLEQICVTHGTAPQVVIENVHAMPGQGVSTTFKFGKAAGIVEGVSCAHPQAFISPQQWKKHCGLKKKPGQSDSEAKDMSRLLAIQTWPSQAEGHFKFKAKGQARADAALLAKAWGEGAR
jgi:crossover junction endodeoxyribonuclease RuvC